MISGREELVLKFIHNIETSINVQLVLIDKLVQNFDNGNTTYLKDLQNLAIFSKKECAKIKKRLKSRTVINEKSNSADSRSIDSSVNNTNNKSEFKFDRLLDKILSPSSGARNDNINLMNTEKPKYEICNAPNSFPAKVQFLPSDLVSPINKNLGSCLHPELFTAEINGPRDNRMWKPSLSASEEKHLSHDPFDMLIVASPNHSMSMSNIEYSGAVEVSSPCRAEMEDMMTIFTTPLSGWLHSADKKLANFVPSLVDLSTMPSALFLSFPVPMPTFVGTDERPPIPIHAEEVTAIDSPTSKQSLLDVTVDSLPPPPPPPLSPTISTGMDDGVTDCGASHVDTVSHNTDTSRRGASLRATSTSRRTAPSLTSSSSPQSHIAGDARSSTSGRDDHTSQVARKEGVKGRSPMVYRNYSSDIPQPSPKPSPSFTPRPQQGAFRPQSPNFKGINSNKLDLRKVDS